MAEPRFPFLPTCCQPIAELLDRENRTGAILFMGRVTNPQ